MKEFHISDGWVRGLTNISWAAVLVYAFGWGFQQFTGALAVVGHIMAGVGLLAAFGVWVVVGLWFLRHIKNDQLYGGLATFYLLASGYALWAVL